MGRRFALATLFVAGCSSPAPPTSDAPAPSASPPPRAERAEPAAAHAPQDGCPQVEGDDAKLFAYDAFGPAAMSYDLLGQAWWQWDGEGHAFDDANGTVWVVVHDNVAPDALANRFPVREAEQCDHRYVSVDVAVAYLEDHIAELDGDDVPEFAPVVEQLRETHAAITKQFR